MQSGLNSCVLYFCLAKVTNVSLFYPGLIDTSAEPEHETEAPIYGLRVPSLTSEELTIVL